MAFAFQAPSPFALGKDAKNGSASPLLIMRRKASSIACCMIPNNGAISSMQLTPSLTRITTTSSMDTAEDLTMPAISKTLVHSNEGIGIVKFLKGKRFLVTGATGFLAKVLVEKMLRSEHDIAKIYVLIKANDKDAAMKRLECEIVDTELFKCLREIHGKNYKAFMWSKLVPLVGDMRKADLGLDPIVADEVAGEVDVIINSAANTTFDERYDVLLDTNTLGPCRLMSFAKRFKTLKLFLHVSTAYVNGKRQGRILEKPFHMGDSIARELATTTPGFAEHTTAVLDIDSEINLAFQTLNSSHGSPTEKMKALGLARARMHGWQNTYVFTKAMGEMLLNNTRDDVPVVVLRPSVTESTCNDPIPGWIEGSRMLDPLIILYGKGQLSCFPMDPNSVLDIVPVDMVANATLAAMAKHGFISEGGMHVYHIASSAINPLTFQDLFQHIYEHFNAHPHIDSNGTPILVDKMKLLHDAEEFASTILKDAIEKGRRAAGSNLHEKLLEKFEKKCMKSVEHSKHLAAIYQPYTFYGGRFDSRNTQRLMGDMSIEEKNVFSFDVRSIDWKEYISNIHIPGLRKYVLKGRGMPH